jgi:hypothetical protein
MKFFHRYKSTIHGNYRRAYLRSGLLTGLMLVLYLLVRWLMGNPAEIPVSYLSDGILLVAVFLFSMLYRNALPNRMVTMKELMLFGIGTALLACAMYGLYIWVLGFAIPEQIELFTGTMMEDAPYADYPAHYWSALWALVAAVVMAILGGLGAFISALILKNEKPEIKGIRNEKK